MTPESLTVAGVIVAALLTVFGVLIGQLYTRIGRLEGQVTRAEDYNRRMWQWARRHVDLYYRHRVPGAPDPEPIPSEDDVR